MATTNIANAEPIVIPVPTVQLNQDNTVLIKNLPSTNHHVNLHKVGFMQIAQKLHDLYEGRHYRNAPINYRLSISYTIVRRANGDIIVRFLFNSAAPAYRINTSKSDISDIFRQLKRLKTQHCRIETAAQNHIYDRYRLSATEIDAAIKECAARFASEVQDFFLKIAEQASAEGHIPDYFGIDHDHK